ncbi:MAG: hypothetical protein JXO49_07580 [Deltaproteobacteria bacterium]|nr:hypothetical protein [Candidatus Anaeroferrophillus wilburensis]MBN2889188.1 hypothetical protein [Deltaproteobacteria bacterium]
MKKAALCMMAMVIMMAPGAVMAKKGGQSGGQSAPSMKAYDHASGKASFNREDGAAGTSMMQEKKQEMEAQENQYQEKQQNRYEEKKAYGEQGAEAEKKYRERLEQSETEAEKRYWNEKLLKLQEKKGGSE